MQYCPKCQRVEPGTLGHTHYVDPVLLGMTVSHGTLRPEDLVPKFEEVLRQLNPEELGRLAGTSAAQLDDEEDAQQYLVAIMDALDEAAPEGYSFKALEGDGSDFGFWPVEKDLD